MPVKTTIQVRRDTAANWTSTNPTLASGEIGLETDTNKTKFGNGSSTWTALSYSASGLKVSDTAPTGATSGDMWLDSSTGKTYTYYDSFWVEQNGANSGSNGYSPARNAIINGGFDFWQRGTSFSGGFPSFTSDRWVCEYSSPTGLTVSQQTFTPGTAPVAGYEGQYFLRYAAGTAAATHGINQKIEDVRTLAGQTVTVSFWAKAAATTTLLVIPSQFFGTGGSAQVDAAGYSPTLTTSWARYSYSVTIPSVAGKTIGAGSCLSLRILNLTNAAFTMDIWGVQLEAGSVATPFSRAGGTLQGELAACRYYYKRNTAGSTYGLVAPTGSASNTTAATITLVDGPMRVSPTSVEYSTIALDDGATVTAVTSVSVGGNSTANIQTLIVNVASGLTQFRPYRVSGNNNAAGYLAVSAEL
jgi:hypothetical protein